MKNRDKLRAEYSRRLGDMVFHFPLGSQTKCDAGYLNGVFGIEFRAEMERRGYDLKTLKFSIAPQVGNQRFASQRKS